MEEIMFEESKEATAVRESSQQATDKSLSNALKAYISHKISKSLSLRGGDFPRGEDSSYVAKAFDDDQFIGTFTFIGERIAVIDFHAVFSPKDECILEDSLILRIGGNKIKVQHLVSYPHYDVSIYKLANDAPPCKFLEFEDEALSIGDDVVLISFPLLGEGDCNTVLPVVSHGKLEQVVPSPSNSFLLAKYECYPGSSGGPVVSRRKGKLIGIHIGSVFHEDTTYNAPCKLNSKAIQLSSGMWSWSSNSQEGCEGLDARSLEDVREVACYAASNAFQKGHHAFFLPASTLKTLISVETFAEETLVKRAMTVSKHGSWKKELRRKTLDKKWRKQMRNLRRLTRAVKVHDCS
ncbi:hypothetical protein GOP47_0020738 [Adiantum capillus-veneris]|uniref:Serine protease n=1 Tax=Adiantum capillus-veneris TaxID=13818 RepID=A0A9D4UAN7_ADICA|nr:hypothetical protein GOP47_0020738 [Adiantum capillus-veneris]